MRLNFGMLLYEISLVVFFFINVSL